MAKREMGKVRLLHLAKLLHEQTDAERGLTMPQIIAKLESEGIPAERKSIYRDLDVLREVGLDIRSLPRRPVEYALASRLFSTSELMLLIDAVQSSRFLTQGKSDALVRSLKALASKREAVALSRRVHVEGRIKMQNESVYHNVDIIQEAIRLRRKIGFHYFKYDAAAKMRLQHGGEQYRETPVSLVYSNDCYYLVAYNDKHADFVHYRVDRMRSIILLDDPATRNEATRSFNAGAYLGCAFGMYRGTKRVVTLLVHESAMSGIVDRFGQDMVVTPAGAPSECGEQSAQSDRATEPSCEQRWARVSAPVMESPAFFAWLAQFGAQVRIEKPTSLACAYASYLEDIVSVYKPSSKARISERKSAP